MTDPNTYNIWGQMLSASDMSSLMANVIVSFAFIMIIKNVFAPLFGSKYATPPRVSLTAKIGNFLLYPLFYFKFSPTFHPLDLKELKSMASKATKLSDFGDDWYEAPYAQTMSLVNKGNYSPIGFASAHDFFLRRLIAKLRIVDNLKSGRSGANALKTPVRKPLFVVGLPRTGTTFLHRLLAMDPGARAPRTWELFDPVPRNEKDGQVNKDEKSRERFVQKAIDKLELVVPHFSKIHEVGSNLPEECMMSMGSDIPMLFATFHLLIREPHESYAWEPGQAYKNYAKVLQILQHQAVEQNNEERMGKRWTLKCPVHLGLLQFLVEGFDDATVVWTHREPEQAVGSLASFIRATQDMHEGSGTIMLDRIGKDVLSFASEMIKRADKFFDNRTKKQTPRCMVMYTELIKDPIGTVKKLYKEVGYEFTAEYEELLEVYVDKNNKERELLKAFGLNKDKNKKDNLHSYSMEEFGITKEQLEGELGWYREKYFK